MHLYVATFHPATDAGLPPVVLIPGLASIMDNFRQVVLGFSRHFPIHWVETREKASSRLGAERDLSVPALASDLLAWMARAPLVDGHFVLVGYSLGASVLIECCRRLGKRPRLVVLVEPNAEFAFPWWSLVLARFAVPLYRPLLPFLKWYVRTFVIDVAADAEMYAIYCRILEAADPWKIARAIRALKPYRAWDGLDRIDVPVLVLGTSRDRLHDYGHTLRIAASIPGAAFVDLATNDRSHSEEVAQVVRAHLVGA